jgi:surfactin synthase thioesterase subunit
MTTDDLWIRRYHQSPEPKIRLACLPHAGGSASYFFSTSAALAPGIETLAVQYPGRQDRRKEPLVDRLDVLADRVAAALLPWGRDVPLALFGHSMGALLAFEVTRRLERAGITPVTLFASGRRAPGTHRFETVHRGDDNAIIAEMRELSGTDTTLLGDADFMRVMLPAVRADYKAIETYRPSREVVAAPIVALVGDTDPKATATETAAWSDHTTGGFELRTFAGGHFYLNRHAPKVLQVISDRLLAPIAG